MIRTRGAWTCCAYLLALAPTGCRKPPSLDQRMGGAWRASMDVGALASKDPLVRGAAKVFGSKPLRIYLDVGPTSLEVRRWSRADERDVSEHASFSRLGGDRLELVTAHGTLAVTVEPAACNAEGQCLELRFHPDPSASTEAQAAMGFLFGCDDAEGKIQCEGRRALRTFYRYPKDQAE